MGKSHQKLLKKEKAKVKLKSSKTVLPKGQNLTDTNFKVKKIVIKDQVKPHSDSDLLTSRKLNVQDLLARLDHHNVNIKKEAFEGLNELILNHPFELIHSNLSVLLNSLGKLVLDLIGSIRKESIKLLANIFSKIECHQLEPFYSSMSSYLICGLTHIDLSIREDSLYFLDVVLKFIPKLCATSISRLLPVCLDLVSHQQDTISRSLSLNLNSTSTSIKWRARVLQRIRMLLSSLVNFKDGQKKILENESNVNILPTRKTYFPFGYKISDHCVSKLRLACVSRDKEDNKQFSVQNFTESIIPLLIDIFVETVPQKEENVGVNADVCTVISEQDAEILLNIVEIILLLWKIIDKEPNSKEKLKNLSKIVGKVVITKLVIEKFPYALRSSSKNPNKKRKLNENEKFDFSCRLQNLNLCKLVILFGKFTEWKFVIPYLKNTFRNEDILNQNECELFTSCISSICLNKHSEESKYFINQLAKSAINSKNLLANYFFNFLSDIALDRNFNDYHHLDNFTLWLESLPKLLTKSKISANNLEKICQITIRHFKPFSQSFDGHIEAILDNIPRLHVDGLDKEKGEIKVASLLYHVEEWDEEFLENLNKAIENEYWGPRITSYIHDIVKLKKQELLQQELQEE